MKSSWNVQEAKKCRGNLLQLRVYTSRLLGTEPSLVLHGGGNTSVKEEVADFFGDLQDVLYIKGSGWDLATIEAEGFAGVKLEVLKRMATLPYLCDTDMAREMRAAMLDPNSPNPSVEAILHAIIPFAFVDHSHSDAVVAVSNTPNGRKKIEDIYGDTVLIVPYVMPGFILARRVYQKTRTLDWKKCQGIILLNHGLFTFGNDAKASYENHIRLVTKAESYIKKHRVTIAVGNHEEINLEELARLRQSVAKVLGSAVVAYVKQDKKSVGFAKLPNVAALASLGTLTPDHVIRIKPSPVIIEKDVSQDVTSYAKNYRSYFNRNATSNLTMLDPAPRWAVWQGKGCVTFGCSYAEALITSDIVDHTIEAIQISEALGGWKVLSEKDIFEVEYWELEQAKLTKKDKTLELQGKVALVTGAASGIGKSTVEALIAQGANVGALDLAAEISQQFPSNSVLGIRCDLTKANDIQKAVHDVLQHFGGLDIVVCNAGIFPPSINLADMDAKTWDKSIAINLTSHQRLLTACVRYLRHGIDPTFIIVGSKNVPAPGPGASAYSVAKAGLTQMARVAALELGADGIRVNVVHPNQVFDTSIWTREVLETRAKRYKMTVAEYKTQNVLKTEITSQDVASLICDLAGSTYAKTTGAQIPIDGGNERVI